MSFLCGASARAQSRAYEGRPIVAIQFPNGQPLDAADLARVQPLKVGQPLRSEDIGHAIDGLFGTGRFDDIVVEAEPSGAGVIVRFVTKNAWFLGGVMVEGRVVHAPNRAQIEGAGEFSLGTPFQDSQVTAATNSIQRLLEANGFYEARIDSSVQHDTSSQLVFLTFRVHTGKRAKYEEPAITGATKLPDATIVHATGWQLPVIHWWRHVTSSLTRNGVQGVLNKYGHQDRLLASVDLKKLDYDAQRRRVRANLDIDAGPKVKVTSVETKVSRRVLKRYVPVFQEHTVDDDLLETGARNLREYFQGQGYYDASVDFRVQPVQDDVETIDYSISRGMRYKLVQVNITGNHYFDTESIRELMFMEPAGFLINRHGRYSEAFRRKDEENVANLYRANGFRDVKVTSTVAPGARGNASDISVTLKIDEGKQWIVNDFSIHGVTSFKSNELPEPASAAGQPFSDVNLASDRDAFLTYYYSHGFPKATFQAAWQQIAPGHVRVEYTITEGNREFIREVLVSGLEHTRPSIVNQEITLKPGDPLSPVEQTNIQRSLYNLGVFANVQTAIENPDGDTTHKNVLYHFEEADRYSLSVGFGAQVAQFGTPNTTTLAGAAGTTGFSPEGSLTVSRLNFLGLGHTITAQGVYSSIEKRGSLTYLQPHVGGATGRDLTYSILYDNELDIRTFAAKREEASVQLSQKFTKSITGLFQFAYRQVSVSDVVIPVLLIPQFVQSVRIGMLSANLVQDRRDNPANPRRGMYNTVNVGLSGRFFGSQRSFARALLRNATYYPIGKNWVLARQTQFGVILPFSPPAGISAEESVPLPERFYAGGADSLRAFPYNEAGPRDIGASLVPGGPSSEPTGFPLGGNALFINNIELRFPLIGQNVQGVLFHDMGNVYSSLSDISFRFHQNSPQDFDYMVHAVGFGIRYRTPVGPLRADFAYSINPPSFVGFSGTPAQLLNCNPNVPQSQLPSYCQSTPQSISHFQFFFSIGQTF
ncbi:MAG TPA: BamA/TamA family outer membrane protein [Bryobacteraceae bacterium]|nr:BamA/TamA family outer membrane protein [Bryobacteraceae bacterium]